MRVWAQNKLQWRRVGWQGQSCRQHVVWAEGSECLEERSAACRQAGSGGDGGGCRRTIETLFRGYAELYCAVLCCAALWGTNPPLSPACCTCVLRPSGKHPYPLPSSSNFAPFAVMDVTEFINTDVVPPISATDVIGSESRAWQRPRVLGVRCHQAARIWQLAAALSPNNLNLFCRPEALLSSSAAPNSLPRLGLKLEGLRCHFHATT